MYSQKENLKKLKKTYKEQAIPKGLKEEIRQRFIIEEQSFIKARRRKETSPRVRSIFGYRNDYNK